jgi:hypothetical protein
LQPCEQRLGEQDQLEPDLVALPVAERQGAKPGVLGVTDAVLDSGVRAVAAFQVNDVSGGLVGDEHLDAPAVGVGNLAPQFFLIMHNCHILDKGNAWTTC